jgi:tRNA (guanine-N7-)-methyltransferase
VAKKKIKRFRENELFPHVIQPDFSTLKNNTFQYKGNWSKLFFKNNAPIILELGCGKGEYTVGLAKINPNINFIGIDIKGARLWRGAKESFDSGLKNVAFLRTKVDFVESCFSTDEISEIWCTFSDPQLGRKKSIKKRLTSTKFLRFYQQVLKNNGIIHLKTDDDILYAYTQDVVVVNSLPVLYDIPDIYAGDYSNIVPPIKTFYEKMWLEKAKTIKYISFKLPVNQKLIEPPINYEREGFENN